jgi:hypothetical protein
MIKPAFNADAAIQKLSQMARGNPAIGEATGAFHAIRFEDEQQPKQDTGQRGDEQKDGK